MNLIGHLTNHVLFSDDIDQAEINLINEPADNVNNELNDHNAVRFLL